MARIRMLTSVAGQGFSWRAGEEIDLPGAEAAKWADGVRAELVRAAPLETPERPAAETSARRPARRKAAPRGPS
ncbi:hypothetical protein H8N00_10675 [Streptomyces sp. AC563]|uniref:hypothetical protein n=2 Tax=Streptomyces buecherae TaxID=2763006 RepID=UPI001A34E036|nr:hypothetical protein [Streptomyces buecherae]MBC3989336.1 hypothetical protein [Streptomyces buecherae]